MRIRPETEATRPIRAASPARRPSLPTTTWSNTTPSRRNSFASESPTDNSYNTKCAVQVDDKTIRIVPPDISLTSRKGAVNVDEKVFSFDKVFPEDGTQEDLYHSVSAHVKATVRGYNTTIFAYGSTGSGKSYTMTGTSASPGIIPRAISEIFSIIETTAAQESDVFFYVRLSYVELYNNKFRNLLEAASRELGQKERNSERTSAYEESEDGMPVPTTPTSRDQRSTSPTQLHPGLLHRTDKIEVRESQSAGVFLAGPSLRIPVITAQEAFQLIAKGNKIRAIGSTQCNDVSSRSHAILTLHVESRVTRSGSGMGLGLSPSLNNMSASSPMSADSDYGGFAFGRSASNLNINAVNGIADTGSNAASVGGGASELRLGKMHLVDLAGSERVTLSGAEGDTLIETQNINLSLTAIGDVLSALSRNAVVMNQQQQMFSQSGKLSGNVTRSASFTSPGSSPSPLFGLGSPRGPGTLVPVPYRNSKLTHLLKGKNILKEAFILLSSCVYVCVTIRCVQRCMRFELIKCGTPQTITWNLPFLLPLTPSPPSFPFLFPPLLILSPTLSY